jgi:hypothetical protein
MEAEGSLRHEFQRSWVASLFCREQQNEREGKMTQEVALKAVEPEKKEIQQKQESVNACAMFTFSRYEFHLAAVNCELGLKFGCYRQQN